MVQELDRREQYAAQMTSTRQAELQARAAAVSDRLPGAHRVRIRRYDPLTGNPAAVRSLRAFRPVALREPPLGGFALQKIRHCRRTQVN